MARVFRSLPLPLSNARPRHRLGIREIERHRSLTFEDRAVRKTMPGARLLRCPYIEEIDIGALKLSVHESNLGKFCVVLLRWMSCQSKRHPKYSALVHNNFLLSCRGEPTLARHCLDGPRLGLHAVASAIALATSSIRQWRGHQTSSRGLSGSVQGPYRFLPMRIWRNRIISAPHFGPSCSRT